jgi:hypothetical protein
MNESSFSSIQENTEDNEQASGSFTKACVKST